jgi:hypothetical protein
MLMRSEGVELTDSGVVQLPNRSCTLSEDTGRVGRRLSSHTLTDLVLDRIRFHVVFESGARVGKWESLEVG